MQPKTISQQIRASITEDAYKAYIRLVIHVLRQYRLSDSDVEEICQDVYFSYFRHLESITPGKEKSWLVTCARNAAIDNIRRAKRIKSEIFNESNTLHSVTHKDFIDFERRDYLQRIELRLEHASQSKLAILADYYINKQPIRAIANSRGMKTSSVTSALHRQRKRLAAILGE
jgi:RNA polymerase sigma factor (sigma-70 family)